MGLIWQYKFNAAVVRMTAKDRLLTLIKTEHSKVATIIGQNSERHNYHREDYTTYH